MHKKAKKKKAVNIIVTTFLLFITLIYLILKNLKFSIKDENGKKLISRGSDPQGAGHFGAPRTHGTHKGHDFQIAPNTGFSLPFDAKIIRKGLVSVGKPQTLLEVTPTGIFEGKILIKIMYSDFAQFQLNQEVKKGEIIGISQNVAAYYGGGMKNHLHIEVRFFNKLYNPSIIFKV